MNNDLIKFEEILTILPQILESLPLTLFIMVVTLFYSIIFGFVLTVMQLKKNRLVRYTAKLYVNIMRGTPLLLLILLVYFGMPLVFQLLNITLDGVGDTFFAILALSLCISAYFSEMMRSAYLSVDKGQMEAVLSSGISPVRGVFRIIFPQALIIAIPNFSNLLINILKSTSLISVIGIVDIFGKTQKISNNGYGVRQLESFISVIIIYWSLCLIIGWIMKLIENKYKYILE